MSIVGHADSVPVRDHSKTTEASRYGSNFELSWARALHVKALLDRILANSDRRGMPREVDIITMAAANENSAILNSKAKECKDNPATREISEDTEGADANVLHAEGTGARSVEIAVSRDIRSCHLKMLDYLYFMAYTITTTGYGDIMPVSPEAKFITTLANLCELLFW